MTDRREEYKRRKRERLREQQLAEQARLTKLGCLVDGKLTHDWKPWDCGCSWGCDCCKFNRECARCWAKS